MVVFRDRERFEPPLPHMPRGAVVAVLAAGVRREKSLHPVPEVAILMGPEYQMEVVGHQAIAQQIHRQTLASVDHRLDEGVIITGLEKTTSRRLPRLRT